MIKVDKIVQILLNLLAFCLPLFPRLVPPLIILLVIFTLVSNIKRPNFRKINNKYVLLFLSFYILHGIGYFYSANETAALIDLRIKIPILIFPLIIPLISVDKVQLQKVFHSFIHGCLGAILVAVIQSTVKYYFTFNPDNYFYGDLSPVLHPGYFSLYLNFGLILILHSLVLEGYAYSQTRKIFYGTILVAFSIFILMLSSKAGIIIMFINFLVSGIYILFIKKQLYIGLSIIVAMLFLTISISFLVPNIRFRLEKSVRVLNEKDLNIQTSTGSRIAVWKTSKLILKEKPLFGVGTGDVKDELIKKYESLGFEKAYEKKLNAHNQFLQTLIALGVVGFLILLFSLLIPLWKSSEGHDFIYTLFLVTIILFLLTESGLERQMGVTFYSFFNAMLFFNGKYSKT